jgi:hypothetical protein
MIRVGKKLKIEIMKKIIIKQYLLILMLLSTVISFAGPPTIGIAFSNVVWSGNGTCQGNVSGTVKLVSNDGCSAGALCFTCLNPSGHIELGRVFLNGPTWQVIATQNFTNQTNLNFSFNFGSSTYGSGPSAGEYTVRVVYDFGGTTGAICQAVTALAPAEGYSLANVNNTPSGLNSYYYNSLYSAPSALSYKIDGNNVSTIAGTYTQLFACQNLSLSTLVTGNLPAGSIYNLTVVRSGVTKTGSFTASPFNLKNFILLQYGSLPGQYSVQIAVTSCGTTAIYKGYIQINANPAAPVSSFTINTTAVFPTNPPVPLVVYACNTQPLIMTGLPANPNPAYLYRIKVDKTNATGVSLGTIVDYTAWNATIPTNLKNLPFVGATSPLLLTIDGNAGYYRISLEAKDVCATPATSISSGLIQLSPSLTLPALTTTMCGEVFATYGTETCLNTTQSTPYILCGQQQNISIGQKVLSTGGSITSYIKTLDKLVGLNWVNVYASPAINIIPTVNQKISPANSATMATLVDNVVYRSSIVLTNPCTVNPITVVQYFQVNTACKKSNFTSPTGIATADEVNEIQIFPVPASHELNIVFADNGNTSHSIQLYDMQGRLQSIPTSIEIGGRAKMDVTSLSKGIYSLHVNGQKVGKKVVIE